MSITVQEIKGETWFKISDSDKQRPFFMSVVSDSNHWMFISSNGGLTAGRKNAEYALFPYYTDDKITELAHTTGSKTIFQVQLNGKTLVWEPFSERGEFRFKTSRNVYKSWHGNKILFEEINHDLGLTFRYQWNSSNLYGFVRKSELTNHSDENRKVRVLDGMQNIMPYGVSSDLQNRSSNLVDAYKRSELVSETGLGIYALSAIIVDKAEPSEALKANVAWSKGLQNPTYLLSSLQLNRFRKQEPLEQEEDIKAEKGAYFLVSDLELSSGSTQKWMMAANVNQNHANVIELNKALKEDKNLEAKVEDDIERGTEKLKQLVAGADGIQRSSDQLKNARHFSNTLFNIMRGGTFDHNYRIEKGDFVAYLKNASKVVVEKNGSFISGLEETFDKFTLNKKLAESDDPDLLRLGKEYLPLKFSRRHGDPSRPWNIFSINTHNEVDGSKILDYEGNWRDIFQNWEALAHSYPKFIEGMIFKFLNASTFDGYNPYRVTKDGFDWEIADADDPWSYIGYWGDHQIIYLLKFLEFYQSHEPEALTQLFDKEVFVYANVPYRIKGYEDIANDPKDTIEFDDVADAEIRDKVEKLGADGALRGSQKDDIHRVNFMEKTLATVLAKVSNFIPEAGIWMNTQRPEWNDANNALVGNGVSMVTLYYLRRFLKFFEPLMDHVEQDEVSVSVEMKTFFEGIHTVLSDHSDLLDGSIGNQDREAITEALGKAGSTFRNKIYENGFSGERTTISISDIADFISTALDYLEHSIEANKRDDELYHAYNIMSFEEDGISISYLQEMLEGQVAALSSGYLTPEESVKMLDALRQSSLYRKDQQSYILYPNKELPGFLERNNIPKKLVEQSELLPQLLENGHRQIIQKDVNGGYHFSGNFKNARDLKEALNELSTTQYADLAKKEEKLILQIFEEVFNHKAFTGRSGTFFAYEGLGSIYWHMVSKLYLAVYEVCEEAYRSNADKSVQQKLARHFEEIGEGIGIHKSPDVYGAFPTDPYSHTPNHKGAQQPGMTGQVKEDIIARIGELGIRVEAGQVEFNPFLLKKEEFTKETRDVELISIQQENYRIEVPEQALAFTYCQVPVVYRISDSDALEVEMSDGSTGKFQHTKLDKEISQQIFKRSGHIKQITVSLKPEHLL
ncbi:hypothetical protein [Gracilimonas tropica]|uniref:hypothetical protein n=1 Tax=Gracilimonas tropica TaxID=454600 RepID=UPI00036346A6|nr:hypothetical protein [Gracilimonas tropica]